MKLPKIKNEQLPPELREILGDGDAEFDAIVDPMDVINIQLDPDAYYEDRHKTALMLVEARKKLNFGARFVITLIIALTFLFLIWLLFYVELPQASRDLINIMVGAYVAVLAKSTDYWFKEKDDPEHKETEKHLENGKAQEEQSGY